MMTYIVNIGRALQGAASFAPKTGARFHFEIPGSVPESRAKSALVTIENVAGHSENGSIAYAAFARPNGDSEFPWETPGCSASAASAKTRGNIDRYRFRNTPCGMRVLL